MTAIDMGGKSLIHNNYVGLEKWPELGVRVPPLIMKDFNGENVSTLNANLRVRHGLVGLSGASEIGSPDATGNTFKETLDGTYVTDGWTGTSTVDDGGRGVPTMVFSDNGYNDTYDLGDRVPMPMLDDVWRQPVTGATVPDPVRGGNYTHANYFKEVLVGDPNNAGDGFINNSVTISTGANYYFNTNGDPNPANRQPVEGQDYIYYNSATKNMEIHGQIYINGDLSFKGQGNNTTITYTGKGAVLCTGNSSIDVNLLTVNPNGTVAGSYPTNCFGIMCRGNLTVGSTAQLKLMGAFYAQGTVASSKQTITMGTFVGNYFNMGTNVPEIYQVPTLADNLPLGMIGNYPIMFLNTVSWRELEWTDEEEDGV